MVETVTKTSLTPAKRHLLELMQEVNFGRIEGLEVRNGEPVFNPLPRVVREIKFGGENGPRPELETNNFTLKTQVVEFLEQLERLGNGTVEKIEVKHGLPFRMNLEEKVRS